MRLNPFRAVRPAPEHAAEVASVPYDVVNREEAAALAEGKPRSFLHIGRSDIDVPPEADPHGAEVYTAARAALDRFLAEGTLLQDEEPAFFLYRLTREGRSQTGIVGCVHVDDYEGGVIRRHEKTRRDKEDDRTRHVLALDANAEPVLLAHRPRPDADRLAEQQMRDTPPLYDFVADDGVRHEVWRVADTRPWSDLFGTIPACYVADGHHRCASAWRAGTELRAANTGHHGAEEYNWFLAAIFPSDQLQILPYNRVVRDLNGLRPDELLRRLADVGEVTSGTGPVPPGPGTVAFFVDGAWHQLRFDPATIDASDPIASLDVSLLQERVLEPVLGVGDPRSDPRVDFVGGGRGVEELERRVRAGRDAIAFSMHPTSLDQLMDVADAGAVMPPKSTWFEPKLRSGLFVHLLR